MFAFSACTCVMLVFTRREFLMLALMLVLVLASLLKTRLKAHACIKVRTAGAAHPIVSSYFGVRLGLKRLHCSNSQIIITGAVANSLTLFNA